MMSNDVLGGRRRSGTYVRKGEMCLFHGSSLWTYAEASSGARGVVAALGKADQKPQRKLPRLRPGGQAAWVEYGLSLHL